MDDLAYMLIAITIGNQGRLTAPPNPWVGCIIVKENKVIGRGFHRKAGEPHAEVNAVQDAINNGKEDLLIGSTVYVTLEPCHHYGRTPPCDLLLIKHQVERVVIALTDPDPRVVGQGIALLSENGIEVTVGIGAEEAKCSLAPYLHHRSTGTPWVIIKSALSLDGKVACADHTSQWITGEEARKDSHQLRASCQAILIGSGTALTDNPRLNVRLEGMSLRPLRVVLDTRGRVMQGNLLDQDQGPTLIYYHQASIETLTQWEKSGVSYKQMPLKDSHLDLNVILTDLGTRGVLTLLVEGGSEIHGAFLAQDLGQELILYLGSKVIGGNGLPWLQVTLGTNISEAKSWRLQKASIMGNDVKLSYLL